MNAITTSAVTLTATYAGALALGYACLSLIVIRARRRQGVSLGNGGDPLLERLIRGHGNFGEYVPFALLLMLLLELSGSSPWLLHGVAAALILGRGLHSYALLRSGGSPLCRTSGMALTLTSLSVAALGCFSLVFR